MTKKVLLIIRNAPYGSIFAAEALRAGIAFAGMDLDTKLVFTDDGVFSVVKDQKPKSMDMTGLSEGFNNAKEFGLKLFVDKESLAKRNLQEEDILKVKQITTKEVKKFIDEAETIINF